MTSAGSSARVADHVDAPSVVAMGGGHGLASTLRALTLLPVSVTAIVGVVDNGGSSGRIRRDLGLPPPGDLRMAIAALADPDHGIWPRVLQHRFAGVEDVEGHALGNLLIAALWEETGDVVGGLDLVSGAVAARGRVLPACLEPVDLIAELRSAGADDGVVVRGQAAVNAIDQGAHGGIAALRLDPGDPAECTEAIEAIDRARAIVLGPGSWYTSVLPHLLVPGIAAALQRSRAPRILVVNLDPEPGETAGFGAHTHLEVWADLFPAQRIDVVIGDRGRVAEVDRLTAAAARVGASVLLDSVAIPGTGCHDPRALAGALRPLVTGHDSAVAG